MALTYYESLNDNPKFTAFCVADYQDALNDIIHLISAHSDDILAISQELRSEFGLETCVVSECATLQRHYSRHSQAAIDEFDCAESAFYCGYFDQLHHLLFHLYELGLRTHPDAAEEKMASMQDKKPPLARYASADNKYRFNLANEERTRLGSLFQRFFQDTSLNKTIGDSLVKFLVENKYDSDAIELDAANAAHENSSNIVIETQSKLYVDLINAFFRNFQRTSPYTHTARRLHVMRI